MSLSSLNQTLTSIKPEALSSQNPLQREATGMDIFLSVITLGIYALYKSGAEEKTRIELLDLGAAFMQWDPARPDIPLTAQIQGKTYEFSDLPNEEGGVQIRECESGNTQTVEGLRLQDIRNTIFSDLMNHKDFYADMEKRVLQNSTFTVDLGGILQERANACADACSSMILKYHGLNYPQASNDRPIFEGSDAAENVRNLNGGSLHLQGLQPIEYQRYACDEILKGLQTGPLLCSLVGHNVVVYGVNTAFDRVEIFCPLLGNRSCSLKDFNHHLEWDDINPPLTQVSKNTPDGQAANSGQLTESDHKPSLLDPLGVQLLKTGYAIGNSWLKSPEAFQNSQ